MKYSKTIGVCAPEKGWVPSPGFILRRAALLEIFKSFEPANALEFGCGPGGMLYELKNMGYEVTGVELSEEARVLSNYLLQDFSDIQVLNTAEELKEESFDYVFAFEVLEHIKDDLSALKSWLSYLRSGGCVVVSVPAHQKRWNITDVTAGHFRRYEKDDIVELLVAAGVDVVSVQTYGWPVTWLLEKVRFIVEKIKVRKDGIEPNSITIGDVELSKKSGVERNTEAKMFWLYGNRYVGQPVCWALLKLQRIFYNTNLGISYIVVGKKNN